MRRHRDKGDENRTRSNSKPYRRRATRRNSRDGELHSKGVRVNMTRLKRKQRSHVNVDRIGTTTSSYQCGQRIHPIIAIEVYGIMGRPWKSLRDRAALGFITSKIIGEHSSFISQLQALKQALLGAKTKLLFVESQGINGKETSS